MVTFGYYSTSGIQDEHMRSVWNNINCDHRNQRQTIVRNVGLIRSLKLRFGYKAVF